jgi:hypothetical protein
MIIAAIIVTYVLGATLFYAIWEEFWDDISAIYGAVFWPIVFPMWLVYNVGKWIVK